MTTRQLLSLQEFIQKYQTQRASETFINALVSKNQRLVITPQEAMPMIWQVLDEDLEGHPLVNTSGEISEARSTAIASYGLRNNAAVGGFPTFGNWGNIYSSDVLMYRARPRFGAADITLSGGVLADTELVPALAGFTGYVQPYALWASDDDEYVLVFQDEDDAALIPTNCDSINVEIKHDNEISPIVQTHGVAGDNSGSSATDVFFYGIADEKALEVDVSGGAGAETIVLWFKYWYET